MTLKSTIRAVATSILLGATVMSAAPVAAASFPFGFGFGYERDARHNPYRFCLERTDRQIRNAVAAEGYRNIYLNVANHRRIEVRATKGEWVYLLTVSTCTGEILDRQRLRRA